MKTALLEKHPELEAVLNKLAGKITADQMSQMNYQVGVEGKSANQVARDFFDSGRDHQVIMRILNRKKSLYLSYLLRISL